uniref:Ig-like domain-containing protein n=1 Tax=Sphaeramia orbicularis TaxID=375764 RepID=A0A673BRF0_9TELE
ESLLLGHDLQSHEKRQNVNLDPDIYVSLPNSSNYVTAVQGLTLTLQCTFETSSTNAYLYWYKQEVNDYPRYMLQINKFVSKTVKAPEFQDNRFDAEINQTSFPLKIQKLHVSDSAVYYCAVRPTVTGNSKTLNKNLWSKDNTVLHNIH